MAGISDFLFGKKALQKAAQTGEPAKSSSSSGSSPIVSQPAFSMQEAAQKAADQAKARQAQSPLSTPMTPQPRSKGKAK